MIGLGDVVHVQAHVKVGLDERGGLHHDLVLQAGDEVRGVAAGDDIGKRAQRADVDAALTRQGTIVRRRAHCHVDLLAACFESAETSEESRLGGCRRMSGRWCAMSQCSVGGSEAAVAKEPAGLVHGEAGEPGRLVVSGDAVGVLDGGRDGGRQWRG